MSPLTAVLGLAPGLAAEVPVVPDADQAREWAREELADPLYHQRPSLLSQAIDWIMEQLNRMFEAAGNVDVRLASLVLGFLVVVGVAVVLLVAGPVRRSRRQRQSAEVFTDDDRTAAEMRASADAFAAAGRWNEATLDRFRAILRSLEERAVLDERPGWTADEASAVAASVLPPCADDLRAASRLFDDVCYGDRAAGPDDDAWLRGVDERVQAARPVAAAPVPELLAAPR